MSLPLVCLFSFYLTFTSCSHISTFSSFLDFSSATPLRDLHSNVIMSLCLSLPLSPKERALSYSSLLPPKSLAQSLALGGGSVYFIPPTHYDEIWHLINCIWDIFNAIENLIRTKKKIVLHTINMCTLGKVTIGAKCQRKYVNWIWT